ncbi:DUF418 domain-containing protein [Erythrobacter sp. JK5]|uniref:DUF418 domain-containing protein n=1 Tax=Erythrobacter sp. JK5 TaxID=2829500 RepID=UPI001BAAA692|nr:DUF418 domain-containing protein [Erythrobacter sp. JK5]QUL38443.1 DUF418 domain-containing protein [Erythrobacter sp. JK5]
MTSPSTGLAPVTSGERLGVLDALRGFALLGVLLANLAEFAGPPWMATGPQLDSLTTAGRDGQTYFLLDWFVFGKANTLFATLFGIGFWVQLERLESRGAAFERIYLRRLFVLLLIGLVHVAFIWEFDILHVYALAGFLLFFMRKVRDRVLISLGVALAVFGRPVFDYLGDLSGIFFDPEPLYADAIILGRQEASEAGRYGDLVQQFWTMTLYEWVAGGLLLGWIIYALGRFLIGAYIARRGWVQRAGELLPQYARVMAVALPLGLLGQYLSASVAADRMGPLLGSELFTDVVDYASIPLTSLGYACLIVLLFHSALRPMATVFGPVGRMALTNYVMQSFLIAFLLFGIGPGLALAGKEGTLALTIYAVIFFLGQIVFSHLWLKMFAFGPLEYLWRWATYGKRPGFRRQPA